MDFSPFSDELCVRDSSAFALMCHVHGFRPEQFRVSVADSVDCSDSTVVFERTFEITQISSGYRRRYRADHFSRGLEEFESDLRAGIFPRGSVDWDWISAHHLS
jgi:hypothetical protein